MGRYAMRYELKIPAIHGDVIPLCLVAEAMARAASTAYGKTPPYKLIFDYQLPTQTKHLLNEARAGRLHVCNQDGVQGAADEIIAAAKSSGDLSEVHRYLVEPDWEKLHRDNPPVVEGVGVWNFSGLDLGATEIDWDTTNILILYSKLHCLNEWGEARGDSFFISDESVGWVDERGYMNPTDAPGAKGEAGAGTSQSGDDKPWLIAATNDPEPDYPWYTPARYFARQLVKDDSTLLVKREKLAEKTAASLARVGIFKRGKKKLPLSAGTVLKSFVNVILN